MSATSSSFLKRSTCIVCNYIRQYSKEPPSSIYKPNEKYTMFPVKTAQEVLQEQEMPVVSYADPKPSHKRRKKPQTFFGCGNLHTGALGLVKHDGSALNQRQIANPRKLHFDKTIRTVGCGYGFTIFVPSSLTGAGLFGCGLNGEGQLGQHFANEDDPQSIFELLLTLQPIELSSPEVTPSARFTRVDCGRSHVVVVSEKHEVFCFGSNSNGQCGYPVKEGTDYLVDAKVHLVKELLDFRIKKVVCGYDHSLCLTECGKVFSWGWNADGQLGIGHTNSTHTPSLVKGDMTDEKIVDISCFADTCLAVNEKGDIFGWGNSEYSQFSVSTDDIQLTIPRKLDFKNLQSKPTSVVAAGSMCGLLTQQGEVYTFGYGQLGHGPNVSRSAEPQLVHPRLFGMDLDNDGSVSKLACGLSHFAAVNYQGALYTWGKNRFGCLGLNTKADQSFPLNVHFRKDIVNDVVCGVDHTIIISEKLAR